MKCPFCNFDDTKVINSRSAEESTSIRRRRSCEGCGKRFTTFERIEKFELLVIKRDGAREIFNSAKLKDGIMKSCNKRPVTISQVEKIISELENVAINEMKKEISTDEIGDFVMKKLKDIDEVSYVRFASVYKKFTDIATFKQELENLSREKE